jgi:hypothetical protein
VDGNRNERGGVLDALANYWFMRIEYADAAERTLVPERNLEDCADSALYRCLRRRGVVEKSGVQGSFGDGFELGLQVASSLMKRPFDCEMPLRHVLDGMVARIKEGESEKNDTV